jgi:threonine dehydrogenase-like Zn-dependent dehydrogenase
MRAIAVEQGETSPSVIEVERPEPSAGEVLVRTLRVGIDGTDHEVIESNHGGYPEGEEFQVLGHEAIGVVEDSNGTALEAGQLVVPTVRRPPGGDAWGSGGEPNEYFERGEPDMAPDGMYVERGIAGAHGYMAEYFTSEPRYLVPVPDAFASIGFLVEPISNSEKAFELARASRSTFEWKPEAAIVLGNGPLGLLTLAMLEEQGFDRRYCLGRRDRPDPTIDVIEELGATYVDSRETPVDELPEAHEPMDLVYEATGYAPHAFETLSALAPNGAGVLLGIPGDDEFQIDGGRLHRQTVLENRALLGSVNSHVPHFEAAVETLRGFPEWFTDAIVTHVYDPGAVEEAFETGRDRIKVVVEFDEP